MSDIAAGKNRIKYLLCQNVSVIAIVLIMVFSVCIKINSCGINADKCAPSSIADDGVPYFIEIDSYFNYEMTEDIMKYGHWGDTIKDGEYWFSDSYAPAGRSVQDYPPFLCYLAILIYRIAALFDHGVKLRAVVWWMSAFIPSLVTIPLYLLSKKLMNDMGAVCVCILAVLDTSYYYRTLPGRFDNDMLVLTLSTAAVYLTVLSFEDKKRSKHVLCIILAGLCMGVFSRTWSGFVFYLCVVFGMIVTYFILSHIPALGISKQRRKSITWDAFLLTLSDIAFVVIMNGSRVFAFLADRMRWLVSIHGESSSSEEVSGFPSATSSIGELKSPELLNGGFWGLFLTGESDNGVLGVINIAGGGVIILEAVIAVIVIIILLIKNKPEKREKNILIFSILIPWIIASSAGMTQGQRFLFIFGVPVSLLAGLSVSISAEYMSKRSVPDRKLICAVILAATLCPTLYGAVGASKENYTPSYGSMVEAADWMKENYPAETILATYWDYGYMYENCSDVKVLFDGGSQTGVRLYWVGRALITDDTKLSAGILRMLSTSGDEATKLSVSLMGDNEKALKLLNDILPMSYEDAKIELLGKWEIKEPDAVKLLKLTHQSGDVPALLCITPHMKDELYWFEYYGTWDGGAGHKGYSGDPTDSVFNKLYYDNGSGQDEFKKVYESGQSGVSLWSISGLDKAE